MADKEHLGEPPPRAPLSRLLRLYLASSQGLARFYNGIRAVHKGLWLGALSEESLKKLTEHHYASTEGGQSQDVDYFGADFNLTGLRYWERDALDRHFGECRSILVGAAGGGREIHALSARFERVDGFECNRCLAAACRRFLRSQGVDALVLDAEPDAVPDALGTYDGALLGWCALIHVIGRQRRIELLRGFRRHLEPGGPLLLSLVLRGDSVSSRLTYQLANGLRFLLRREPVELGDRLSSTFDHGSTRDEICAELAEAGFEMVLFDKRLAEAHVVGLAR